MTNKQPHRGDQSQREKDFPDEAYQIQVRENRKRWQCILKALVVQVDGDMLMCVCVDSKKSSSLSKREAVFTLRYENLLRKRKTLMQIQV